MHGLELTLCWEDSTMRMVSNTVMTVLSAEGLCLNLQSESANFRLFSFFFLFPFLKFKMLHFLVLICFLSFLFNFLIWEVSNIHKSRVNNKMNFHQPISQTQCLLTVCHFFCPHSPSTQHSFFPFGFLKARPRHTI